MSGYRSEFSKPLHLRIFRYTFDQECGAGVGPAVTGTFFPEPDPFSTLVSEPDPELPKFQAVRKRTTGAGTFCSQPEPGPFLTLGSEPDPVNYCGTRAV